MALVGNESQNQLAASCNSLDMSTLPDPRDFYGTPEHRELVEQRRAEHQAAAQAESERRKAILAKKKAAKDREAKRVRQRHRIIKRVKRCRATQRRKQRYGKRAAMLVARWAFDRADSEGSVRWKDRRNWVDRLVRLITKQVRNHLADKLGSAELLKMNQRFWEEVARSIFICYRKTGQHPPESVVKDRCGFPLD